MDKQDSIFDSASDLATIRKGMIKFGQKKLEAEVQKNWDRFYKRNGTVFFKDRHWTHREFIQICPDIDWQNPLKVLECGCGVGNLVFPLLVYFPTIFVYACDFSSNAIHYLKNHDSFDPTRCSAFICDLTEDPLSAHVEEDSIDVVTMVFMLSAVHPKKMASVLMNVAKVLKPGGSVLFRDYAVTDYAMRRFGSGRKLSSHFYVRQDGTYAYYFSKECLTELFRQGGFDVKSSDYISRETVNRKENLAVSRTFIQGRFIKR